MLPWTTCPTHADSPFTAQLIESGIACSSAFATEYIESHLLAALLSLLTRLRLLLRSSYSSSSQQPPPPPPYAALFLLLLQHDPLLHYRLTLYLSYEDARKRGRESAYGFSELEAPAPAPSTTESQLPSVGAGATSRPAPEDAWLYPSPVEDNLSYLYDNSANALLRPAHPYEQRDVLALFEEHAAAPGEKEQRRRLEQQQKRITAKETGWEGHMRRMYGHDQRAKGTQVSEYVQLEETRCQAGFLGAQVLHMGGGGAQSSAAAAAATSSSAFASSTSVATTIAGGSSSTKARSLKRFKDFIG